MMKLSTMLALLDTLDEQWRSPLAEQILALWDHTPGSVYFFRASANFLFIFKHDEQNYFLRFNHASERTPAYIEAELAYIQYLARHNIDAAQPVLSIANRLVETVQTELGEYHAVVFQALPSEHKPGEHKEFEDITLAEFESWGEALGKFHQAGVGYASQDRPTWQDHLDSIAHHLPVTEVAAKQLLTHLSKRLNELPRHAQNFGLIHFDFELDNLVWKNGRAGILDFDDCSGYWWVADIAFALRDLVEDRADAVDLADARLVAFVQGYRTAKQITSAELALIPLFLQWHNLYSFVRIQRSLDLFSNLPVDLALGIEHATDRPARLLNLHMRLVGIMDKYRENFARYIAI